MIPILVAKWWYETQYLRKSSLEQTLKYFPFNNVVGEAKILWDQNVKTYFETKTHY